MAAITRRGFESLKPEAIGQMQGLAPRICGRCGGSVVMSSCARSARAARRNSTSMRLRRTATVRLVGDLQPPEGRHDRACTGHLVEQARGCAGRRRGLRPG